MVGRPGEKGKNQEKAEPWKTSGNSDAHLQRLDRLANLGTLSAGIAHEIRNGLVPIRTFVELMLQKSDDQELAAAVERELKRIDSLVCQMLRFGGPKPAEFAPVQIHDVLEISLKLLQHQIDAKLVSVERDFKAVPGVIHGDEAQLQQVIMNLLLNALESMNSNGIITVSTEVAQSDHGVHLLKVSIRDTGIGISKENLDLVFEPFFTTKRNGTGLGLAISQRVALEHHGKIEAESNPGKGSTFTISLPVTR